MQWASGRMSYKKRQVIKTNIPVMKGLDSLLIAFIVLEQYLAYSTCYVFATTILALKFN